jgi:hypothetical protein
MNGEPVKREFKDLRRGDVFECCYGPAVCLGVGKFTTHYGNRIFSGRPKDGIKYWGRIKPRQYDNKGLALAIEDQYGKEFLDFKERRAKEMALCSKK